MSVLVGVVAAPALSTRAGAQTPNGVVCGCDIAKKPLFDFGSVGSEPLERNEEEVEVFGADAWAGV